ncbi:hypothetical protein [Methylobacterium sp. CCH5-D2]|uniref:hypothetical protein n=1 Tax=Methylobacterium sp. CCH5-D2 TaxID=1768765 RepID=UPI00082EF57D|nr:hypothetical protein [Methylobacterium sp. CCH5-D2]
MASTEPRTVRGPDYQASEDDLIRAHYPRRGAQWCSDRLPGRTVNSVYGRARALGVATAREVVRITTTPLIDAMIQAAYRGARPRGFVGALARRTARPDWWIPRRAAELGLTPSRDQRTWSQEEQDYADAHPLDAPAVLAKKMRAHGWHRTPGAIAWRRAHGQVERFDSERFTAAGLAEVMGVDPKIVVGWIRNGWLAARTRWQPTKDSPGREGFIIHERDVARFIVAHPTRVSLAKLEPNKVWLIDLLARHARPATTTGRQGSKPAELGAAA